MEKARCDGTQTHDRANRQIDTSRENDQGHGKGHECGFPDMRGEFSLDFPLEKGVVQFAHDEPERHAQPNEQAFGGHKP